MRNEKFLFEKLIVYQRSVAFATNISKKAASFPLKFSKVSDQLIRASLSVPPNIAEGSGRATVKDRMNFFRISRSSLFESVALLSISRNLNLIDQIFLEKYRTEATELSKMLASLIKYS